MLTTTFSTPAMSSALSLMHNTTTLQTSYSAAFPPIRGINSSAITSYSYKPAGTAISASSEWKTITNTIPTVVASNGQQSYAASTSDDTYAVMISTTLSSAPMPTATTSTLSSTETSSQRPAVQDPYTWSTTSRLFWTTQPSVAIPYTWSTTSRIYRTALPSEQIPNPFFTNSGVAVSTFTGDRKLSGAPPKATQKASWCEMEVCPPGSFDCHCPDSARAAPPPMPSTSLPSCRDVLCPFGSVDCCVEG